MSLRQNQTRPSSNGSFAVHPAATSAQSGLGDQDHFAVQARLWGALHDRLGQARVAELLAEGPRDETELQILHVAGFVESTGLDAEAYLPWNAPLSWQARTAPFYRILWQSMREEQGAADLEAAAIQGADSGDFGSGDSAAFADGWAGFSTEGMGGDIEGEAVSAGPAMAGEGSDLGGMGGEGAVLSREAIGGGLPSEGFERWFGGRLNAAGGGRALSSAEQDFLREIHGRDFPEVRVHEGPTVRAVSQAISAAAFTMGNDIYVGQTGGLLSGPDAAGLLAHEATHVVQAGGGRLPTPSGDGLEVSQPNQPHEREAEAIGHRAAAVFNTFIQADPNEVGTEPSSDGWSLDPGWDSDPVGRAVAAHLRAVLPAGVQADEASVAEGLHTALRGRASASLAEQHVLTDLAESLGTDGETVDAVRAALGHLEGSLVESADLSSLMDLSGAPSADDLVSISAETSPLPGFAEMSASMVSAADSGGGEGYLSGAGLGGMLFGADTGSLSRRAQAGGGASDASGAVDAALQTRGHGQSLPDDLRMRLEAKLGVNLRDVRLHTDARAAEASDAVRAEAFTVGTDIYLNRGGPSLTSTAGMELLAHEVTHAAQHLEGRSGQATDVEGGVGVTRPGDAVEQEAEAVGAEFAHEFATGDLDSGSDADQASAGAESGAASDSAGVAAGAAGAAGALARDEKEEGNKKAATPEGQTGDQAGTRDVLDGSAAKGGERGKPGSRVASNAPAKGDVFTENEGRAISEKWKNPGAYQDSDAGDQKPTGAWTGYKAQVQDLLKRPGEALAPSEKKTIKDWLGRYEEHQIWNLRKTGDAPPIPGDPPEALISAPAGEGHMGAPPDNTHEKVAKYEIARQDGTTQVTYKDHPVQSDYASLLQPQVPARGVSSVAERKDAERPFAQAGIADPAQRSVMRVVSEVEGGFGANGTPASGRLSASALQASTGKDGTGGLVDSLLDSKNADPNKFASYFHDLGVDVDRGGLTIVDPTSGRMLHGSDAVTAVVKDTRLSTVFQQAGAAAGGAQPTQVQSAAEKLYPADMSMKPIPVQSVTDADGETEYFYGDQARHQAEAAQKKAGDGATVGKHAPITGTLGDAFPSEAGQAALMDRMAQTGSVKKQVTDAAVESLREHQVTDVDDLAKHERDMIPHVQNRVKVLGRKDLRQPK